MQKKKNKEEKLIVVSLGGSIVYPYGNGHPIGPDVEFLKRFREFILSQTKRGKRFVIVVGGGKPCRMYQKAAREVLGDKKNDLDLDWIGIQTTRTNALFVAKILKEVSFPQVLDREPGKKEINAFLSSNKKVLMASGWQPGWSTDYDAVKCAILFGCDEVVLVGDTAYVYDKDPRKFPEAQKISDISWSDYQKLIPSKWVPGLSTPVDPSAARIAKKFNITAKRTGGADMENVRQAIDGGPFDGSTIHK